MRCKVIDAEAFDAVNALHAVILLRRAVPMCVRKPCAPYRIDKFVFMFYMPFMERVTAKRASGVQRVSACAPNQKSDKLRKPKKTPKLRFFQIYINLSGPDNAGFNGYLRDSLDEYINETMLRILKVSLLQFVIYIILLHYLSLLDFGFVIVVVVCQRKH
ncbi:hypothetical protein KIN20_031033 [Parelaphostrongylus tenuis]|uniref:Uncharacterized protein n=1 Tax=Parelaphostrongylus tenuis TaxID=148309 RepID=A0AAD5WHB5_PARTN|nr:hypothetical protein KIN20_031033 [Parelaphostrongylus tenuis]